MSSQAVGTYKLNAFWEAGRLIYYEKASGHTTTGNVFILGHDYVQVGDTANDVDLNWYGTTTGTFLLDASAHTLTMTGMATTVTGGALTMGASASPSGDFTLYGTQATLKVWFDVNGDTNGAFYFGADDYGCDVSFYGQTASNSMIWDASANALVFTAGGITMGTGSKMVLPYKASGSSTAGDVWVDSDDGGIHWYATGIEYKVTFSAA